MLKPKFRFFNKVWCISEKYRIFIRNSANTQTVNCNYRKMKFNIFKILEKDNKELIHSAFIKFLLEEYKGFQNDFLGNTLMENCTINLEKSFSYKKRKNDKSNKGRFDIEILNNNEVIIIENKFKSFPLSSQLEGYNNAISKLYPNQVVNKILLCFDKELVTENLGWKTLDYGDLIPLIEKLNIKTDNQEKKIFINHYTDLLKEYYETYNVVNKDISYYLSNQKDNRNKFWVSLIYSNLAIRLEKYFKLNSIDVNIISNTGNTKTPIINIIPKHWNVKGVELLIQIQDGIVKFYAHTGDKKFLKDIREFMKTKVKSDYGEIKKNDKRKSKSEYIARINFMKKLKENQSFSADTLFKIILVFYDRINSEIIKNYS